MRPSTSPTMVTVLSGLVLTLLAGCSTQESAGVDTGPAALPAVVLGWFHGSPAESVPTYERDRPNDVVLLGADRLQVVLFGSSTCPLFPDSVVLTAPATITISTTRVDIVGNPTPDGSSSCSADLSPTTSTVAIPRGVDAHGPFHVVVDGIDHVLRPAA